jgi:hypothetical protein
MIRKLRDTGDTGDTATALLLVARCGRGGLYWCRSAGGHLSPAWCRAQVPGLGGVGQVVGGRRHVGAAAFEDRAGCLGDGLGGLPDTGEVCSGPAGDVGEAVAAGVQPVRGGHIRE